MQDKNKMKGFQMKVFRICILLLLGLNVGFALGENLQSIEADFEQFIVSEDGIPAHYEGKIYGKAPNKVKWDYTNPLKKEIYMKDSSVLIYEPSLEQVSRSHLNEKTDFISIIKSAKKQPDGTYRTKVEGTQYVLFVDKNDTPERIEFVDSMGSKTILKLTKVKINPKIQDKIFEFSVPKGVEVVDIKTR